ncbi:DUF2834 domain-containing protein [Mycolicibacterium flavescens]|uniref:DUF2834 domain-containing protein n=1 Tax=Mycolicibacterium flavescens TaxID=1776 RepID=A0A1E3RCB9_MYCFV|nr:DUF2834 domain-containing protein [Mycolicibacterium flavescens]MCV7278543.1 DUF2834 domain-containing protein [Mycolicibacterium flavescens]ODQ87421.1 hypothetical protein BHQ18_23830 [Mycolicibacterium flavescens]
MSEPEPLPTTTKLLCVAYAVIAVVALIATWSQNLTYAGRGADFATAFWEDTKTTAAARSITADIALFLLAAVILMVYEARKHGIRFVWVYVIASFFIAVSVTFPLFLLARELRIHRSAAPRIGAGDKVGLALVTVGVAAFTIWVDVL